MIKKARMSAVQAITGALGALFLAGAYAPAATFEEGAAQAIASGAAQAQAQREVALPLYVKGQPTLGTVGNTPIQAIGLKKELEQKCADLGGSLDKKTEISATHLFFPLQTAVVVGDCRIAQQ